MQLSSGTIDLLKWVVVAIGAVVSFYVIDYGKLQLERFRATAENQRQLLDAYLKATESTQTDVWKRKLHILENFAADEQMRKWAQTERQFIDDYSELDALYRETLKVASQLVDPTQINDLERARARIRYDQLYWADLVFARESESVEGAMVAFRKQLLLAESKPADNEAWRDLSFRLIELSQALRDSKPKYPTRDAAKAK
jgi:hypothetical protein